MSDVVDEFDLSAIESVYGEEDRGQPPYHPRMMTKIVVYGYCVGVFSSRRIQKRLESFQLKAVPGELLFRVTTGHVTLLRPKRPADAPPMFILSLQMTPASARPLLTQLPEYRDPPQEIRSAD